MTTCLASSPRVTSRGQSLIVWAIAEGRSAARGVDAYLMGASDLPAPLSSRSPLGLPVHHPRRRRVTTSAATAMLAMIAALNTACGRLSGASIAA